MIDFCKLLKTEIVGGHDPHIVGIAADPGGKQYKFMFDKKRNQVICFPGSSGSDDPGFQAIRGFLSDFFIHE